MNVAGYQGQSVNTDQLLKSTEKNGPQASKPPLAAENLIDAAKVSAGGVYENRPAFAGQMKVMPDSCDFREEQFGHFNVTTKEGREDLNALLKRAHPPEAPQIVIGEKRTDFSPQKGHTFVSVWYREVYYLQIKGSEISKLVAALKQIPEVPAQAPMR